MDGSNTPQFLSTATAARMLGLSTTLIQSLVDTNELQGWKTRGGHRRISLQSVQTYRTQTRTPHTTPDRKVPAIMVVAEAPDTLQDLRQHCDTSGFAVELRLIDSITEALLILGSERPDLLVVEMSMPRPQQEKTMAALENFNARGGRPIPMVLLTQDSQWRAEAAAVNPIQLAPGPLSAPWLHAYLTGVVTTCRN